MRASRIVLGILVFAFAAVLPGGSQGAPQKAAAVSSVTKGAGISAKSAQASADEEFTLAEGEKRFRQNCGRCHVAPDKYPPRVMATVLRHMRVRATITDRDARLILWYMTR
jgi:mono/diheme cytochrome c family protein